MKNTNVEKKKNCRYCKNEFLTNANRNVYCSIKCRLYSEISIKNSNQCWEWIGHRDRDEYGRFKFNYINYGSHRVSYELSFGYIPKGLLVMHSCDNPPCCNPEHLLLGTEKSNAVDRDMKGRCPKNFGEKNGMHKLSTADVLFIKNSNESPYILAEKFSVKPNCIWRIKSGERRKNG